MEPETRSNPVTAKKISVLSIISFCFCLGIIGMMMLSSFIQASEMTVDQNIKSILGLISILLGISSLVLGIIDVCKKNRIKVLSIISIVFTGGVSLLFILITLTLYTAS